MYALELQTGTLFANGNKFDSSLDRNSPLPLTRQLYMLSTGVG